MKSDNRSLVPMELNDGLAISTLAEQQLDEKKIKQAFDIFYSNKLPLSRGLTIIRNNFLVAEAYARDRSDIDKIDNIQSCTKSITALLIGMAIQDGLIASVNDPISKYIPEYFNTDASKRKISIRNCLTMQGGLEFGGNGESEKMVNTSGSSIEFVLKKPMLADTGSTFLYSDLLPQLLTGLLHKVTPDGVEAYAKQKLFDPLGIDQYIWEKTKDGINIGAFSIFITNRDLAKIGMLCVNNGVFDGLQIVGSDWIKVSSQKQAKDAPYGYGFYVNSDQSYQMRGNGGQFVYIDPIKKLVITYTALPYSGPSLWGNTTELVNLIRDACN
ncbi:serine hydrolase domain-containing protein [Pedobacter deserti]|uniref:serine hydrolase domain-containing protein n=1 Tax=Pedobacter deserti TaxID=2817382 RepID=UPI00210BBD64|nr:serine hydrolase [Pedobacter sp. SYSU D00382]